MKANEIYCGDMLKLTPQLTEAPKLAIMSPPDLSETEYSLEEYQDFLGRAYGLVSDKLDKNGVMVSITTDRKLKGQIYTKHIDIINRTPLTLFNYKIWAKSLKTNLYILTYCHMLFFKKGKVKQNKLKEFYPDVWLMELDKLSWYPSKDSFPTELVRRLVLNFTQEGDLVLDPFIGSGKTAKVCLEHNRRFIGFDLDCKIVELSKKHLL